MDKLQLPHNAYVFVGDGRKALFLRNEGDAKFPNLKTEEVFTANNPATRDQGTDKQGKANGAAGAPRSSVEQTDWHDLEEQRFAHDVAAALERVVRERNVEALVVVAPPRTLAELRQTLHKDVKQKVIAEFDKDLTNQPLHEIEKHLVH